MTFEALIVIGCLFMCLTWVIAWWLNKKQGNCFD